MVNMKIFLEKKIKNIAYISLTLLYLILMELYSYPTRIMVFNFIPS